MGAAAGAINATFAGTAELLKATGEAQALQAQKKWVERMGDNSLRDAYRRERSLRRRGDYILSRARVSITKGNVRADRGTPLDYLADAARELERERAQVREAGVYQKRLSRYQGELLKHQKRAAMISGVISMFGAGFSSFIGSGGMGGGGS